MSWVLASLALILAALALREARRAARPAPSPPQSPPPPSPPAPREDLGEIETRIERVVRDLADAQGARRTLEHRSTELERRLDDVTDRLATLGQEFAEAVASPPAPPLEAEEEPEPPTPEQQVYDHLREKGWEEIVLLPAPPSTDTWLVEATRAGHPAKGKVRLFEDGRVESRLVPPTRAFP